MLLILVIIRTMIGFDVAAPEKHAVPAETAAFEVTECSPQTRALLLARIRSDFAPSLKDTGIEQAYCIDPFGFQAPEAEIELLSAGQAVDPGMPRMDGQGGEAAWLLRNAFNDRPALQPARVTDWFMRFSGDNSYQAVAIYPDGRSAVIYYRD
ncbi:MAG: hypothetical protein DI616_06880 [Paracoccus denitrificans]|uniref:Uncharacterized protein n=1 Tax=Paracoccus denitrificans TaxID=266 RepID=A0A533I7A2_PARDE|nr:MAG: hypothetical protein DI616_06880 [Paracoccus denitrificans]